MLRISGGQLKGHKIFIKSSKVKPTSELVRQAIFNTVEVENLSFLDVFCGTGIVGIEALSRGASFVCFVDNDNSLIQQLKENLLKLEIHQEKYKIIKANWESSIKILEKENKKFDIVFLDPFYNFKDYQKLLNSLSPIIHPYSIIILEHSSRTKIELPQPILIDQKTYGETILKFISLTKP